jgi:hypothetical protein
VGVGLDNIGRTRRRARHSSALSIPRATNPQSLRLGGRGPYRACTQSLAGITGRPVVPESSIPSLSALTTAMVSTTTSTDTARHPVAPVLPGSRSQGAMGAALPALVLFRHEGLPLLKAPPSLLPPSRKEGAPLRKACHTSPEDALPGLYQPQMAKLPLCPPRRPFIK